MQLQSDYALFKHYNFNIKTRKRCFRIISEISWLLKVNCHAFREHSILHGIHLYQFSFFSRTVTRHALHIKYYMYQSKRCHVAGGYHKKDINKMMKNMVKMYIFSCLIEDHDSYGLSVSPVTAVTHQALTDLEEHRLVTLITTQFECCYCFHGFGTHVQT